jgi:plastocyanin
VPGTTGRWYWAGHGRTHSVVAAAGSFDSGDPVTHAGTTLEYTFGSGGEYAYRCGEHGTDGMRGTVVVPPPESGSPELDRWFVDVEACDGTLVDATGRGAVTVTVGTPGNGGSFAFDPAALEVARGTTVRWTWTGDGSPDRRVPVARRRVTRGDPRTGRRRRVHRRRAWELPVRLPPAPVARGDGGYRGRVSRATTAVGATWAGGSATSAGRSVQTAVSPYSQRSV